MNNNSGDQFDSSSSDASSNALTKAIDSKWAMYEIMVDEVAHRSYEKDGKVIVERYETIRELIRSIDYFVDQIIKSNKENKKRNDELGFTWKEDKKVPDIRGRIVRSELSNFYKPFILYTRLEKPNLKYSENVELFFDTISEMNLREYPISLEMGPHIPVPKPVPEKELALKIKSDELAPGRDPMLENLRVGDLFNDFIRRIKETANSNKFKKKARDREANSKRNFNSVIQYFDSLFKKYTDLLLLRVDFGYSEDIALRVTPEQAHRDIKHFLNNKRHNKLFKSQVGYIWKLEDGEQHGLHFHVIFILNGSLSQKDAHLTEEYGKYWIKCTQDRGIYYNCNRDPRKYKNFCVGKINYRDEIKRGDLKTLFKYLMKKDQYMRIKEGWTFDKGSLPRKCNKRTGRPLKNTQVVSI